MSEIKRRKGRPLLLAAAGALSLTIAGCGDDVTGTGNLMAPNCDLEPQYCGIKDMSVPDLTPPLDLSKKD